ncbi:hypothetical protein KY290_014786 [Solanum tuberosum]|uniref:Uncharacterized protein n=1 Tax=Solanum tuberosum TaxID=4113 RepID=A0ABQ7VSL0_SOLTU|nr:hypothetical protein KY284_014192 [Solanum tuberosum]KAH0770805.1 hypothetical protein KY290_014786 [Solanum tuberosum]
MGRKALRKKVNYSIVNDDMVPPENSKIMPVKENLPTQHVEELIYRDDLKKHCKFDIFEGDKFFYLRGDRVINDYDGLVECGDDSDVRNMMVSYKMHKKKLIEIYTLSKNYNIVMSTSLGEYEPRDNTSEEVNEVIMEEHELANSAGSNIVKRKVRGPTQCIKIINSQEGEKLNVEFDKDFQAIGKNATQFIWFWGQTIRSRSCCPLKVNGWKEIEQDKIDHMWYIILNKPKHFGADEWKYLVNLWSDADFQKRSLQNKTNRSKRSLPPYIGTKSYARLRHKMEKDGKTPSRVDVFMESRKRKKGKQVDAFQPDVIDQFDQFKKQQEKG